MHGSEILYENCKDFLYFIQTMKYKSTVPSFKKYLEKLPFDEVIYLKNEIEDSLYAVNIIKQKNRKSGLTTILSFLIAYEAYFNKEEDKGIVYISNTEKYTSEIIVMFLLYFEDIFKLGLELKKTKKAKKGKIINESTLILNIGDFNIVFIKETSLTVQTLQNLEIKNPKLYYDNSKVSNPKKLEGIISRFIDEGLICIIAAVDAEIEDLTDSKIKNHKLIDYKTKGF